MEIKVKDEQASIKIIDTSDIIDPTILKLCINDNGIKYKGYIEGNWIVSEQSNILGGKKMEDILNIYKERREKEIVSKFDKEIAEVKSKDEFQILIKEFNDKYLELFRKYNDSISYVSQIVINEMTEKTKKIIKDIVEKREQEINELRILIKEVQAQYLLAEKYEDKINVLKIYEILDKKGKINA